MRLGRGWRVPALGALVMMVMSGDVVAKESYVVIVVGLGGEESYRERFHGWAMMMREAALEHYRVPEDRVFYLGEKPELAPDVIRARSTKKNVSALFDELEGRVRPGDQIFVLLLGHGSFRSEQSRFNLPGPDLTAEDFQGLLEPFSEQQIIFVNTASASGSFVPTLSNPNRILVTATKTGLERNETQFGKYFVEAYAGDGADVDKNERVSVLEAFNYARRMVDEYYQQENLLKTEHALLDDDGDGEGVHDPGEDEGEFASAAYLLGPAAVAEGVDPEILKEDPELARLVEKKTELEGRVEALRLQKDSMPEEMYLEELERLLLELAETTQQIEERTRQP